MFPTSQLVPSKEDLGLRLDTSPAGDRVHRGQSKNNSGTGPNSTASPRPGLRSRLHTRVPCSSGGSWPSQPSDMGSRGAVPRVTTSRQDGVGRKWPEWHVIFLQRLCPRGRPSPRPGGHTVVSGLAGSSSGQGFFQQGRPQHLCLAPSCLPSTECSGMRHSSESKPGCVPRAHTPMEGGTSVLHVGN